MNNGYPEALSRYLESIKVLDTAEIADFLRLEHHFECLKDFSSFHSLKQVQEWFTRQRESCRMQVEEIPLNQCRSWLTDSETGNTSHESGEFFRVHGVRVSHSDQREVGAGGWDQPIVTQVGYDGGLLGILRLRFAGVPHYLIEAKAEPGNYGKLQLSPTLQATFSNLKRAHKARKPRFAELFEEPSASGANVLRKAWLSEDGGRLYLKRNLGMLVELPEGSQVELPETFIWMSMHQIKSCLLEDAWVNPHIRGIISLI